jgi:hypothetical protein
VNAIEGINGRFHAVWQGVRSGQLSLLVQCFTLDGTNKKRGIFGSGKAQTAAIPGGIARIGNTARAAKTLFCVPDSVKRCTRIIAARRAPAGRRAGSPAPLWGGLPGFAHSCFDSFLRFYTKRLKQIS